MTSSCTGKTVEKAKPSVPATLNPAKDSDGSVRVKAEPGYEFKGPNSDLNGYPSSGMNTQVAQQRAAILLQQQYGSQANASIGALQQQTGLTFPGQSHPNNVATTSAPPIPVPSHPQPLPQLNTAEEEERKPGINRSQNDGAGDEQHEIDETKKHANDPGRRPMRAKVQDMVQELESGLLMPLNDRPKPRNVQIQTKKRAVRKLDDHLEQAMASKAEPSSIPQLDGERTVKTEDDDENEELDEDAINSDLDDSEDEVSREQDEEVDLGETMLCLYDKVQRVKNKWKCTLKDGVLTTGGKE